MRVVIIFTLVVVLFGGFNWLTARQLVRLHPRRKRIVIALLVIGNAMWLFLPWLRARGDAMRLIRATLGPPWFAWLCFAIVYSIVILAIFVAWLPFARRVDFVRFARRPSRVFLWATLVGLVAYYAGGAAADAIQTYGFYAAGGIVVATIAVMLGMRWWERRMLAKAE